MTRTRRSCPSAGSSTSNSRASRAGPGGRAAVAFRHAEQALSDLGDELEQVQGTANRHPGRGTGGDRPGRAGRDRREARERRRRGRASRPRADEAPAGAEAVVHAPAVTRRRGRRAQAASIQARKPSRPRRIQALSGSCPPSGNDVTAGVTSSAGITPVGRLDLRLNAASAFSPQDRCGDRGQQGDQHAEAGEHVDDQEVPGVPARLRSW